MANNNHFELALDTLAPTGSIGGLNEFEKENKVLTIVSGDATFKKVWFDSLDADEVSKDCDGYKNAVWEAANAEVMSAFNATGIYYYHLVLMDDVNNESEIYTLGPIHYDQDAPVVKNVLIKDSRDNSSNTNQAEGLQLSFEYSDVGTGVQKAIVEGDIEGDLAARTILLVASNTKYEGTFDFKKVDGSVVDGNKSVTVTVYDAAENASAAVTSNVLLLDRDIDKPTLLIKKDGVNIPAYINYREYEAQLTSVESNIVAYKIWEGETEPDAWIEQEAGTLDVTVSMTFSANDGKKSVKAKVRDVSGNIIESDVRETIIDTQAPVAEATLDKSIISKVDGFNKAILTFGATADNENGSGIEYYEIRRNGEKITFGETVPANYEVTVGTLEDGLYNYELMVRDRAKNETISSKAELVIDTTSPELSIVQPNPWYTDTFDVTVSYSDNNNLEEMAAWYSTVAADETLPANAIVIGPSKTIAASNIGGELKETANNYIHVMLVDEVGNKSFAHARFGYDKTNPELKSCQFTLAAYPSKDATIKLTYSDGDNGSGVVEMRVSGDITDGTANGKWEPIVSTRSVKLSENDGIKTVLVEIRDAAGLVSSKEISCELDTTFPMPVVNLYEADGINTKADHSALATFGIRLEIQNDDVLGGAEYKVYGDFTHGSQAANGLDENDVEWAAFVADEGKSYMSIRDLYCTVGDGTKHIYAKVRDNAGNITTLTDPKVFEYDTTAPSVVIEDYDYNRISKVHVERRDTSGLIVGEYADQVHFTLKPDSEIQAYKVCAYLTASAAAAVEDVEKEVAIGTTYGSVNMSRTGLKSSDVISSVINGADYEAALGEVGKVDGAHFVVVYVQDLAGTWSIAAQF